MTWNNVVTDSSQSCRIVFNTFFVDLTSCLAQSKIIRMHASACTQRAMFQIYISWCHQDFNSSSARQLGQFMQLSHNAQAILSMYVVMFKSILTLQWKTSSQLFDKYFCHFSGVLCLVLIQHMLSSTNVTFLKTSDVFHVIVYVNQIQICFMFRKLLLYNVIRMSYLGFAYWLPFIIQMNRSYFKLLPVN